MRGIYLFTLADVPVWVSPWYLLIVVIIVRFQASMAEMLAAAVAMTLSLLVHEFGHALTAKRFRLNPKVLLHGMGGMCMHDRARSNGQDALIIAAGPLSGLFLGVAGLVYVTLYAFQTTPALSSLPAELPLSTWLQLVWAQGLPSTPVAAAFVSNLVFFCVVWSLFNLLPLWPMDGGQLYRLLMLRFFKPALAERITHISAIVVVAGLAYFAFDFIGPFAVMILAFMGLQNYQALTRGGDTPVRQRESRLALELLMRAERAWDQGDDDEAVRLCHQLRAESNVSEKVLNRAWQILGVAATRREDYDEAISYLKRAPQSREVVEATAQCLYQLDRFDDLRELTEQPAFQKLDAETQAQVKRALEEDAPAA